MEIKYNNKNDSFDITDLSWNDTYRIYLALRKISDLIEKKQFATEYNQQEAAELKKKYEKMIWFFDNCKDFPKGMAKGLDETILESL